MQSDAILSDSFYTLKYLGLEPILIARFGSREWQFSHSKFPRSMERPCIQVATMTAGWIMAGDPDRLPLGLAEHMEDLVLEYVSVMEL